MMMKLLTIRLYDMTRVDIPVLQIAVGEQIALPKTRVNGALRKFLRDTLFILNSEYIIKERIGKPLYNVPKFFNLIEESLPYVLLPRGFLGQLTDFLTKEHIAYEVTYNHPQLAACKYSSIIQLKPAQIPIVEQALKAGSGVIVAPPGSGKTIMGLELIARHGKPALILTHRKQLLDQWVAQIQEQLGLPKKQIGRYSSAYKKPSERVSVGLLQSFARAKDLTEFTDKFGVIIVDECHHIPATTFRAVISRLNATHIYGLTATPKRKHNDERLIYLYIGDIVATMEASPVIHDSKQPGFTLTVRKTSLQLPFDWKQDQFELLAKVICYDTTRNELLVKDVMQQVRLKRKTLVLSERKEHLAMLDLYLRDQANVIVFSGDDSASKRAAKLQRIHDGDYDVLLATGQIFGEGMHVANIEALILAFPFAFEGKLAQYVGRLLHSTKPRELVDYHDAQVAVLDKQYKQRLRYYKKIQVA